MDNHGIKMIPFSDAHAALFSSLNRAWLKKYFVLEPADEEMLSRPKEYILDRGGHIFFAKIGEEIVGTFALLNEGDRVFELSKMAVAQQHQGKKIGNKMLAFCLEKAKELQASRVILYSNTILEPAIHLYRKFGFREIPFFHSQYKRSNIKMEVEIN